MVFWLFKKKRDDEQIEHVHRVMNDAFSKVKKDINNVAEWINHLDEHKKRHGKKLSEVDVRLKRMEKMYYDLARLNSENHEQLKKSVQKRSVQENGDEDEHVQSFNRSDQTIMNIQSLKNMTPAQKQVVLLLLNAEIPLDYESIGKRLGISVVTARRHLNDIKRYESGIKEKVSVKNRRKVFYLDERSKKALKRDKLENSDQK